ncbi:MAG: transcription elongation factor GreB [Rhodospirillaceae bacterium]
MSKAFTKETEPEEPEADDGPALPRGAKNYITPAGLERLRAELKHLNSVERPEVVAVVSWAAGNGDRSENGDYIYGKKRLREIDLRIRFLLKRLDIAEPVDPALQTNREQVFFGATVTYCDDDDVERTVRIVGIDEARLEEGEVSWISPVARALMQKRLGDTAKLQTPKGVVEIEVLEIAYAD